ncbi:MAG: hypothetical protein U9R51_05035, partial [Actinomycetota bacterium]|nr:hypothetical protein [Actinomycetota bacterium]
MEDHEQQIRSLKQELLDERSQRHAAEQRSADLSDRVDVWRTRAEERANRIDRLVEERPGRLLGWLRPKASPPKIQSNPEPTSTGSESRDRGFPSPGLRSIRVAALVSNPGSLAALDVMDCHPATDSGSIDDADLVVIESSALEASGDPTGLRSLLSRESGPPVVLWDPMSDPSGFPDAFGVPVSLPPTFDPAVHSPAARWRIDGPEFVADAARVSSPDDALIEHAAAGGVIVPEAGIELDGVARSAASAVARRWAFRNHAPWVRARELTDAAGIGTYDPWPSVAGVLVSNRPEMLPSALENMAQQTYGRFLLVVGLHGIGDASLVTDHVERLGIARRTQVVQIPESETLGDALNRCIDRTNADIIAKIDDDDAYGPSYIEDAVHAL